jgi:hypothetical protein
MAHHGWIGVDVDGTLSEYNGWVAGDHCGPPVPAMLARVKAWLEEGKDVRIFTARIAHDGSPKRLQDAELARTAIVEWCKLYVGCELPITNMKDYGMIELWDDRCVQVRPNTGVSLEEEIAKGITLLRELNAQMLARTQQDTITGD